MIRCDRVRRGLLYVLWIRRLNLCMDRLLDMLRSVCLWSRCRVVLNSCHVGACQYIRRGLNGLCWCRGDLWAAWSDGAIQHLYRDDLSDILRNVHGWHAMLWGLDSLYVDLLRMLC